MELLKLPFGDCLRERETQEQTEKPWTQGTPDWKISSRVGTVRRGDIDRFQFIPQS